jgi:small basic protein (TIGR04137 family)
MVGRNGPLRDRGPNGIGFFIDIAAFQAIIFGLDRDGRKRMSIHRSLVPKNALKRSRNVLTRMERLKKLMDESRWSEGMSVFGLPKVLALKKSKKRKGKKKKEDEGDAEAQAGASPNSDATQA